MAALKQCEFFVLRYVPDVVKGELVNIGIVLLGDGEDGFTDVRFTHDWRRLRCADPDADIELLESFEADLRLRLQSRLPEIINYRGPMSRRDWLLAQMQQSFSGALDLAPMSPVLTESPVDELTKLAQIHLESKSRATRAQTGRRAIFNTMRGAFQQAGVWPFMRTNIEVAPFTHKGDPLKIDCGYRPNGVIHLFHALSLDTDVNSAKVLAFSYPALQDGLQRSEHAQSNLTAIVEDDFASDPEAIAFALQTLEDSEIAVARVSQMPALAEQARLELKL